MKLKILCLLLISLTFINAVPETVTKKCEESSFCRRCRKAQNDFGYAADLNSLVTHGNGFTIDVTNNKTSNRLVLKLECLESNTFRFQIDEKSPLKTRFRVTEVISEEPVAISGTVSTDSVSVNVTCGNNRASLKNNPFTLEFYENGVRVVSVNRRQLMRFEELRYKPSQPSFYEDRDEWEETWEGYTDSKPNGPEAVAIDFTFDHSDILFGIPAHHDTFALKSTLYGEPYRLTTTDMTFYELDSRRPNYGVIPVIYGHGASGRSVGIFWHNSADTYVDIYDGQTSHFISEGGVIDVFVYLGPSPNEVFMQNSKITGVTNLPQLFTLAYHQCRWSYLTQTEVLTIAQNFDKYDVPLDTMWLDIDWTRGKRYFEWDYEAFPAPLDMMAELKENGRHLVQIIDPHIKVDEDYRFYRENKEKDFYVKTRNGTNFEGDCWPGLSSYVDFFNPEARKFYADQYLLENFPENSVENGIWNDMNEPAVFNAPEKTFPKDTKHFGDVEHRLVHNAYGMMQTKGTYDGLMRRGEGKYRPFILTRSFFAGSQKYTAVWTGDNQADWGHLKASIQVCLSISVAGMSFCGSDIGGFFGDPEEELIVRWTQAAAFQPFFRNHASSGTKYREPWMFSEMTLNLTRDAIRKRYQFLPFWYTLFYEHEVTGVPVMRPLFTQYPLDKNVFNLETQHMLGDKLLVAPVLDRSAKVVLVYFPSIDGGDVGDIWYDIDTYKRYEGVGYHVIEAPMDKIPVFQRGGTIIAKRLTARKSSVYMRDDPFSLYVAINKSQRAEGTLYYDDETSFDYREKNNFDYLNFKFTGTLKVEVMFDNFKGIKFKEVYIAGLVYTPTSGEFRCKSNNQTTLLDDSKIHTVSENFVHVGISGIECDYEWEIYFNGSERTILTGSLVFIVVAIKFFL